MAPVLLRTTLAALMAVIGAVLGLSLGRASRSRLNMLLFGATGTLLAVVVGDVLPDAKATLSWSAFLIAAATGYGLFYLFNRYVYHICPSCAFSDFDKGTVEKLGQTAVLLMLALGIHSTLDGVAVVVGDEIGRRANTGVLLAVVFHKLPEGCALAVLLLAAGYARRTALLWTIAIESTTILGGILGLFALRGASPQMLGLLFAHVGGGFLFLIAGTLRTLWDNKAQFPTRPLIMVSSLAFAGTATLLYAIRAYSA